LGPRQLISFALNSPAYSTTIRYVRKPAPDLSARSSRRDPLPETFAAQLPTLVKSPPSGPQWIHEIKYDGYRIGARIKLSIVNLFTRNGNDWTSAFLEIAAAMKELPVKEALIDGEAAVLLHDGTTSFQALQGAMRHQERNLSRLPLEERKAILRRIIDKLPATDAVIHYSLHFDEDGAGVLREACRMGLEGIVSKRRDLPYETGRNRSWLKTKCVKRQEFVIGGFTDPEGSRVGMGALLVGVNQGGHLRFAGKVGTGFSSDLLTEIHQRLKALERKESPFSPKPAGWLGRNAHWVKPELVAEVEFTEWTEDGKIRHPSFQGLREDKPASEIIRENPTQCRTNALSLSPPKRARGRKSLHL
jgi:bifunctional non-homologous end joining protein LigD